MAASPHTFVAASSLTADTFTTQFPFVKSASLDLLPESLFSESSLDQNIVKIVLHTEILPELVKWQGIFRSGKESSNRPILNSLLPALRALSMGIEGTHAGLVFDAVGTGSSSPDSASSSRGLSCVNEDGDNLPARQSADIVAYVLDKKLYEDNGHIERLSQACKLIIEQRTSLLEHWIDGPGGFFQLGAYMVHHGTHDFHNGRRSPIYGVALSLNQWAAAELRVDGVVTIKAGSIEKHTMLSMEALDRVVNIMNTVKIHDGVHVVARFYFQQHPFTGFSWIPPTVPVFRLIESLLRICVGDRILKWTVQEVKQRLSAYKQDIVDEIMLYHAIH